MDGDRDDVLEAEGSELKPSEVSITLSAPRHTASGRVALLGARIVTMRGDEILPQGDVDRVNLASERGHHGVPVGRESVSRQQIGRDMPLLFVPVDGIHEPPLVTALEIPQAEARPGVVPRAVDERSSVRGEGRAEPTAVGGGERFELAGLPVQSS